MSVKSLRTKYSPEKTSSSFFTQKHIQVSNDGNHIFCQCSNCVTIVETNSGTVINTIECEEDEVYTFSLSPDNSSLAVGFRSSSIKHYKLKGYRNINPQLFTSFKSYHTGPVVKMCWDSSSVLLASGGADGSIRVWDLTKKYCTHSLKGAHGVVSVISFSKNLMKRPWIYGAIGENIFIWFLEAGNSKLLAKLEGHDSAITALQQTHSNKYLISCGLDKVIILWDLMTFESKKIIPVFESLSGIIIKPPNLNFYNIKEENEEQNIVFAIGNNGVPRIWNVESGKELWKAMNPIVPLSDKDDLLFNHVSLNKNLNSFVLTSSENIIYLLNYIIILGEENNFTAVATNSNQMRIYENSNNNCHLVCGHSGVVFALANHPSNRYIYGSGSHDNTARIWKLKENGESECLAIASGHTHSVGCLAFGKDFMITGSNDTCIKRWNINLKTLSESTTKNLVSHRTQQAHSKNINFIALSKKSNLIATCSFDKTAKIWNADSFEVLGTLNGHSKGVWSVQFSPTDYLVATSSADATIKLWSLSTYDNVATFEGHETGVLRILWISQGQQLVSSSSDGILNLWSVKGNISVGSFDEHNGRVWALVSADDGAHIVTGASDSKIVLWKDVTEEEKRKELEKQQRIIEEEQILMNLLHEKKWSKALRYSLRLKQPFRGLTIMKSLLDESPETLPLVLRKLRTDELHTLMEYVVSWNTKTTNVREAQSVLNFVLKEYTPEEIEAIPNWQSILEGLLPYTEKHFKRVSALQQAVSILDYMTACMSIGPMEDLLAEIDDKNLEDTEAALLRTIPKEIQKGLITIKDDNKSNTHNEAVDYDAEDSSEYDDDDDFVETELKNEDAPLNSVDDLQSNFAHEDVMSESDGEDNENSNSKESYEESDSDET
ncbi:Transducin beta-like protein 3 [Armadillidium vulgare]|nr:Transducin beta-like protein 3 [Armadillidium vulgare]